MRHPRYGKATEFFRSDLYGASDVRQRDRDIERVYPTLVRLLSANALEAIATALELDALSESLDRDVAAILHTEEHTGRIDDTVYGEAYRRAGRRGERERQIELIVTAGGELDRLVRMPLVYSSLKLMRAPAKLAGLGDLQSFLEKGYTAFREMRGAAEFLAIVRTREEAILQKLFAGSKDPFAVPTA